MMNAKVYLAGLGGGLLVSGALVYPLYLYLPGLFVPGWPPADARLAWAFGLLALILLLGSGAGAARLGGLEGRRGAAACGAVAGGIAALLADIFIVAQAGGIWASRALLSNGLQPFKDNYSFISALVDNVLTVILWGQIVFWVMIVGGLLLGALAGLAAGPGGKRGSHLDVLGVPMSIAGELSAAAALMISLFTFGTLVEVTRNAADKVGYTNLPYPFVGMLVMATAASIAYLTVWQLLAWLALRKAGAGATVRRISWDVSGILSALMPGLLFLLFWLFNPEIILSYPVAIVVVVCVSILAGFPAFRTAWRLHHLPRLSERSPLHPGWFLAGAGVLLFLALAGVYVAGAGPAINLTMLSIAMLPSMIPLAEGGPLHDPSVPGDLVGILQAHFLAPVKILLIAVPSLLIPIAGLTALVILFDRAHPIYLFFRGLFVRKAKAE